MCTRYQWRFCFIIIIVFLKIPVCREQDVCGCFGGNSFFSTINKIFLSFFQTVLLFVFLLLLRYVRSTIFYSFFIGKYICYLLSATRTFIRKGKKRGAVFFLLFQLSDICYTSECISGHLAISLSLMLRINTAMYSIAFVT